MNSAHYRIKCVTHIIHIRINIICYLYSLFESTLMVREIYFRLPIYRVIFLYHFQIKVFIGITVSKSLINCHFRGFFKVLISPVHMFFDLLHQMHNRLALFKICKCLLKKNILFHFVDNQNMYEDRISPISFDYIQ